MELTHIILITLVILFILFLIYGYLANFRFVITKYDIESKELYDISNNKPFVILSDLHNCMFGKNNKKLINAIDAISPEFILIAGDMVNNASEDNNQIARELMDELQSKYNIIYGDGNHEQGFFSDEFGEFDEKKFTSFYSYLQSETICDKVLKGNIFEHVANSYYQVGKVRFYGIRTSREFYGRFKQPVMLDEYISELLGDNNKEYYNVLIAHNPMYFDYYERWGADLVISGHIHGGIMRLPYLGGVISPQIRLFPKYSGGLYTINGAKMILSRGLGTHTIRFRFFNPPELVVVNPINRER